MRNWSATLKHILVVAGVTATGAGEELVKRIFFMATFGPIYAWYVIAKTVIKYTPEPENTKQSKRLVYKKSEENLIK